MFYYVDCPECKKDLSRFATEENLVAAEPTYCIFCEAKLRLMYTEIDDEEMGNSCVMYYFEKWEAE